MRREQRVILLEFNELSSSLMNRFLRQGKLPAFERLRRDSLVWTTDADETQEELEPWIQWVTVHTGLSFGDHKVFRLDESSNCKSPQLWDLVSQTKRKAWVCGSMNTAYGEQFDGYLLPDPWSSGVRAQPVGEFDPYFRFVRAYVQEYSNDKVPLNKSDYISFATFMATHGLSSGTVTAIIRQLMDERHDDVGWKRATLLDQLQWDVFSHYYRKLNPALSTFFLNSTAHLQHVYWRNLEPDAFTVRPSAKEQALYANAIEHGYRQMDALVSRCLDMAGDEATIIFATALGGQPCLIYEATGGKRVYRPRDINQLLHFARIDGLQASPVMSGQYLLRANDETQADIAAERLRGLRVDGRRLLDVEPDGRNILTGCCITDSLPEGARLEGPEGDTPFFKIFYLMDITKSGMHHPDGMLWIRGPDRRHHEYPEKVSIRAIAPTILDLLGIDKPDSMPATSLLKQEIRSRELIAQVEPLLPELN